MKSEPFLSGVTEDEIRRKRQKAREIGTTQWWKRKRAAGVCHHCGERFPPQELTMDHLIPVVRGGKSVKGNVVPSCKPCNTERNQARAAEGRRARCISVLEEG